MTAEPLRNTAFLIRPGFWTAGQCADVRSAIDRGRATAAEIYANGYVVDEQVRKTFDVEVDPAVVEDVERALARFQGEVSRFFATALRGTEGPGFLRYPSGGFYRRHRDRLESSGEEFPRKISVVLFLSSAAEGPGEDRCQGGALRLHGVGDPTDDSIPLDILPAAGTLVAFLSTVPHEVLPVTAGIRDAIVDWFY